jgi:hypothetical protein
MSFLPSNFDDLRFPSIHMDEARSTAHKLLLQRAFSPVGLIERV